VVAFLAATAGALRPVPAPALRAPDLKGNFRQRTRTLFAQQLAPGWITGIDPASGATYYYNEQTGQSQWEPPANDAAAQQGYGTGVGTGVVWRIMPGHWDEPPPGHWGGQNSQSTGVKHEYIVRPGEKQVLGRNDMLEENPYVSRSQCAIEVGVDGKATLFSIGKPPTVLRARKGAPWYGLRMDESRVLAHGEEVSLVQQTPESAFFTITCEQEGGQQVQQGADMGGAGYDVQYSEDGQWMWNGAEWVPAR